MKQGWEIKKLGEVFDLQMGKTPSRDNSDYWGDTNVWVAISDLQDKYIGDSKEYITDKALTETKIKKVKAGTTIMSFKLSVGRAAITTKDLYTNEAIMAFNLNDGYNLIADYIYYYLKGYKWQGANKAVMGITLNKASISQNHIVIPPLVEQEKIVEELDSLSGVIEKKKEQLKELDSLAQSIFYTMFGDPITNEKGWEVKKIKDVAPQQEYKGNVPCVDGKYWLLNLDMIIPNTGEIIEKCYFDYDEIGNSTIIFNTDNVLYSKLRPYLNKVVIPNDVGYGTSELVPLKPHKDLLNKVFFASLLRSSYFVKYISTKVAGAKMPRVAMGEFREFEVILPPFVLQQEFADKIEAIEKQKELIKQSITETEELFNSRMDYYFN